MTDFGIKIIQSQRLAVGHMNDFESGKETRFGYTLKIKQKQDTQHGDKLRIHHMDGKQQQERNKTEKFEKFIALLICSPME